MRVLQASPGFFDDQHKSSNLRTTIQGRIAGREHGLFRARLAL